MWDWYNNDYAVYNMIKSYYSSLDVFINALHT